jgi:hypothetical protein
MHDDCGTPQNSTMLKLMQISHRQVQCWLMSHEYAENHENNAVLDNKNFITSSYQSQFNFLLLKVLLIYERSG